MGAATWVLIGLVTDAILRAIGIVISPDGTIGTLAFLFPLVAGIRGKASSLALEPPGIGS